MTARELRAARAQGAPRRTYWCLEQLTHKPTDYQIVSSRLLYHPGRGFEVRTPVLAQPPSALRGEDWDRFVEPLQLTYAAYVAERRDQEAFLERLLERPSRPLPRALVSLLEPLSALRFPLHGLQMTAAYVGAFVPSGRIAIAAAFQAADELRRIQKLCAWLSRSGVSAAELDARGRQTWHESLDVQPLRRLIEELLVCYDWGQALFALNGLIKPVFDRLWFEQLASVAERHDDEVLEKILISLGDDGRWHEQWFAAFSRLALESHAGNAETLAGWVGQLRPRVTEAAQAFLRACQPAFGDEGGRAYVWRELEAGLNAHLTNSGLCNGKNGGTEHERSP